MRESTTLGLQVLQVPYGTNSSGDARSRHIVIGETPFRWLRLKPAKTAFGNMGMSGDIVIAGALRHRTLSDREATMHFAPAIDNIT
jgi:hypothetical protein